MSAKSRITVLLALSVTVLAASSGVALAGKGFYTLNDSVRSGMLVSLTKNQDVVEPADTNNASMLAGVAGITDTDYDVLPEQTAVQLNGVVNTIVTTINGGIKVGDRIGTSSVVGLGAKMTQSGWIVGTAQAGLDANTTGAVKSMVTDTSGKQQEVFVATIPVLVNVTYFDTQQQNEKKTIPVPTKVQDLADSLAGRRASQVAIVLSFLLLIIGFVIAGIIVNAAVRNGIKSIARQPLVKQAITKEMTRSIGVALSILLGSVLGAFVLLRLL